VRYDTHIDDLLRTEHIIMLRDHLPLQQALARGAQTGRLARMLPGVYVDAGAAQDRQIKIAAIMRWDPDAVICGRAAASLTYWEDIDVDTIEVASSTRHASQPGFRFSHRTVPPEFVQQVGEIRLTSPSLTAIELATLDFTDPIDIALRKRQATLASLTEALRATPQRAGNRHRWEVLLDSRAEPWSRAERLAHRLYRGAGLSGWVTNRETVIPDWATYYIDIAFERQRVATEIDGELHDRDAGMFEGDRLRQNALVLRGWIVLRFTWRMLTEYPDYVVSTTREALAVADRCR
jgi:very-short-patch-repair endonuclease